MNQARIAVPNPDELDAAAQLLLAGHAIGMPTETVYGLAADATQPRAVQRVYAHKRRPAENPLIVHVAEGMFQGHESSSAALAGRGIVSIGDEQLASRVDALIDRFWPGPLTLVLPRGTRLGPELSAGRATVAVRAPAHPVAAALIARADRPLVAPSANRSGHISPTTAEAVVEELGDCIPLVLDGGPCTLGLESTVIEVQASSWRLLRPGMVGPAELSKQLGPQDETKNTNASGDGLVSPGLLSAHYAPRTPLVLLEHRIPLARELVFGAVLPADGSVGLLLPQPVAPEELSAIEDVLRSHRCSLRCVRHLSKTGSAKDAAARLFACLRELDALSADVLLAVLWPVEEGVGVAINDRIRRAAYATLGRS